MVKVSSSIIISRPVGVVSAYSADPDHAPSWYVNIQSVEWKTPKPLQEGTQVTFVAHFLGRKLKYTYEMVAYTPGLQLVMRTAEGPFPMETTYTWAVQDEGHTHMTLQNKGNPSGFSKLVAPFIALMMQRENKKDLKRLKMILEKDGQGN